GPLWRDEGAGANENAPTATAWKGVIGQVIGSGRPVVARSAAGLPEGYASFVGLPIYAGGGLSHIVAWYN
ncbi:MAG: GAF domain-containing protein, partial [Jannaschia sp.]